VVVAFAKSVNRNEGVAVTYKWWLSHGVNLTVHRLEGAAVVASANGDYGWVVIFDNSWPYRMSRHVK